MKFFMDSANIQEIQHGLELGLVDGVTTNPALLAREAGDWQEIASSICSMVQGPVSLEVMGSEAGEMVQEARELARLGSNIVVKIPMTMQGLKAVRILTDENIATNVTLVFSPLQALLAAKAGAGYVSPFVGRLDDLGQNGMDLASQIIDIYENYAIDTQIIVASVRHPGHVLESALMGADIVTVPYKVLNMLAEHPMTDLGIKSFLQAWQTREK